MFSFTLDIYCTSVRPGRGIPHMWLSLRFLLSFYLLKGFFSSFSLLLLRVKGRGWCHTLLKPYETNCGLWIWAIQIKFDWLIDWKSAPQDFFHPEEFACASFNSLPLSSTRLKREHQEVFLMAGDITINIFIQKILNVLLHPFTQPQLSPLF